MSYKYEEERPRLFTDEGQRMFLKIRERTRTLLETSGAAMCEKMISGNTGSSWQMLACVDRMVELEEIQEITGPCVAGQHRVFVSRTLV